MDLLSSILNDMSKPLPTIEQPKGLVKRKWEEVEYEENQQKLDCTQIPLKKRKRIAHTIQTKDMYGLEEALNEMQAKKSRFILLQKEENQKQQQKQQKKETKLSNNNKNAQKIEINENYGCVPIINKTDCRTMAEVQIKKKPEIKQKEQKQEPQQIIEAQVSDKYKNSVKIETNGCGRPIKNETDFGKKTKSKLQKQQKQQKEIKCNYRDKYAHLIGDTVALKAPQKIQRNSSYGCVPVKNKTDFRTIEETMADIKAKKRLKLQLQQKQQQQQQL